VRASALSRVTSVKSRENWGPGWASRCPWGTRGQATSSMRARGTMARGAACATLTSAAPAVPWTGTLGTRCGALCVVSTVTGSAQSARVAGEVSSARVVSSIRSGGRSGSAASLPRGRIPWPLSRGGFSCGPNRCCMWWMPWGQIFEAWMTDICSDLIVQYLPALSLPHPFFFFSHS